MLYDIAVLTGATVIGEEQERELQNVRIADLGCAVKVTATEDDGS